MRSVHDGFRGSQRYFGRYDSCVITDQLATGAGELERELLGEQPGAVSSLMQSPHLQRSAIQNV